MEVHVVRVEQVAVGIGCFELSIRDFIWERVGILGEIRKAPHGDPADRLLDFTVERVDSHVGDIACDELFGEQSCANLTAASVSRRVAWGDKCDPHRSLCQLSPCRFNKVVLATVTDILNFEAEFLEETLDLLGGTTDSFDLLCVNFTEHVTAVRLQ